VKCVWYIIGEHKNINLCKVDAPFMHEGSSFCEIHIYEALTGSMGQAWI
jgi:hypothetical protein